MPDGSRHSLLSEAVPVCESGFPPTFAVQFTQDRSGRKQYFEPSKYQSREICSALYRRDNSSSIPPITVRLGIGTPAIS